MLNISGKSYAAEACYRNFFTGSDAAWSKDGKWIYCLNGSEVTKIEVETGLVSRSYGLYYNEQGEKISGEEETEDKIFCFDLSPSQNYLATAHRSSLVRLWNLHSGKVEKLWKSQHRGQIVKTVFNPDGRLLCTSADATLRLWDYENKRCLAVLKEFIGPSVLLHFHPNPSKLEIFAAGSDHCLYKWNYNTKALEIKMKGHLSQITAFAFSDSTADCEYLASVSRDKVLIVWSLLDGKQLKVIPMYEELIGVVYKSPESIVVAGANGNLKNVFGRNYKILPILECQEEEYEINTLLINLIKQQLAVVTTDHNILIFDVVSEEKVTCIKQLIGFNDEVLDICFIGESEEFLAMATNSKHIKLYDINNNMNCNIVMGHKDTIMSLSSPGRSKFLLSAGKDLIIILWQLEVKHANLVCLAKYLNSHTDTIGCISFASNCVKSFASVCQSGSLKVWSLKIKTSQLKDYKLSLKYAAVAHDKEVNCVVYSPNNKIIATASQDKTAKLWSTDSNSIIGSLKGHTRGVWCVRFSPIDQIILTTSSDCSLRLWSLANLSCLKRLEQSTTVLKAEFMDSGKCILTSGSDGLLKMWDVKTNTCIQSLDEHTDRIWSLAVSSKEHKYFFSAGADSKLVKWKDITEECKNIEINKRQEMLQQEQDLQLLLHKNIELKKALTLALKLGKPTVSYNILNEYIKHRDMNATEEIISVLSNDQKLRLLGHVKDWSCNSRHTEVTSVVLQQLLKEILVDMKVQHVKILIEVITAYIQRHFKRITELSREIHFLDFVAESI